MLLGYFKMGQQSNQCMAEALFTDSIATSRKLLMKNIWHPSLNDSVISAAFDKGDDIDFIIHFIENELKKHERINSVEKVIQIIMDTNACKFKHVTSSEKSDLHKKYKNMTSIPLTLKEEQLQQLDNAYKFYIEEDNEGDEQEEEEEEHEEEEEENDINVSIWKTQQREGNEYSWFRTVWYRINYATRFLAQFQKIFGQKNLFIVQKVRVFVNSHLKIVQYLDSLIDPSDTNIDTSKLQFPHLLTSTPDDYNAYKITKTKHKIKETPLRVIQRVFPNLKWTVEETIPLIDHNSDKYIDDIWAPLLAEDTDPHTHSIYLSCIRIINQCKQCMKLPATELNVCDALWYYYASFVDFFYYCAPYDDNYLLTPLHSKAQRGGGVLIGNRLSPWEIHGSNLDVRCFTASDLPDVYHILTGITLYGEQNLPGYVLGKVYQKSLPFACQRRHLIRLIVGNIENDHAFWKIFSKLFWVALASLYPHFLTTDPRERNQLSMRDLLRIKEITESKELLSKAITSKQPGFDNVSSSSGGGVVGKSAGASGGPLIVHIIFRLHILYMASFNPIYIETAKDCIDWDYFSSNSIKLSDILRDYEMFADDAFGLARKELSKTVKNPHSKVHRIRKYSKTKCITSVLNETLEKIIIKDEHVRTKDNVILKAFFSQHKDSKNFNDLCQKEKIHEKIQQSVLDQKLSNLEMIQKQIELNQMAIEMYKRVFNTSYYKSPILNLLLRIPKEDRLKTDAFQVLTLPEYGNISAKSVQLMEELTNIYYESAKPQDFKNCIDHILLEEFMVVCFYFNMVNRVDKINFGILDADTVERTDKAMILNRYSLFPDQELSDRVFDVCICLCCEKVCNLTGYGKYGSKKITYDLEKQYFICAHKKKQKKALIKIDEMNNKNKEKQQEQKNREDEEEEDEDEDEHDDENEEEDEEEDNEDGVQNILNVQLDAVEDFSLAFLKTSDFMNDVTTKNGRGLIKTNEMTSKKEMRNKRKQFLKIPCNQPVLIISLRGRSLIWGNVLQKKTQYMFCPGCGALHMYTILNFSNSENGKYRCNECAKKELRHLSHKTCAYCNNKVNGIPNEDQYLLSIMNIEERKVERLYFCRLHFLIAKRYCNNLTKVDLWKAIQNLEHKKMLDFAKKQ
jgi:hypothetical protein